MGVCVNSYAKLVSVQVIDYSYIGGWAWHYQEVGIQANVHHRPCVYLALFEIIVLLWGITALWHNSMLIVSR